MISTPWGEQLLLCSALQSWVWGRLQGCDISEESSILVPCPFEYSIPKSVTLFKAQFKSQFENTDFKRNVCFQIDTLVSENLLYLFQCMLITSCLFAPIKSNEASALILFWNRMKIRLTIVYYSCKTSAQLQKLFCAVSLNTRLQTLRHRWVFFEHCFSVTTETLCYA